MRPEQDLVNQGPSGQDAVKCVVLWVLLLAGNVGLRAGRGYPGTRESM